MSEFVNKNSASPIEGEGVRGDGKPKWYAIHTYSGYENKVKTNIEGIVKNRGMQDLILDIAVPMERRKVEKTKKQDGKEYKVTEFKEFKLMPGYVMIKMIVTNESWYIVRNTQGVTGFAGFGTDPVPLSDDEIKRWRLDEGPNFEDGVFDETGDDITINPNVKVGDKVKILDAFCQGEVAEVVRINLDKKTISVIAQAFGRDTPMEVSFDKVEKL